MLRAAFRDMRVMVGSMARPSRNAQTVQAPAALSGLTPDNYMPRRNSLGVYATLKKS